MSLPGREGYRYEIAKFLSSQLKSVYIKFYKELTIDNWLVLVSHRSSSNICMIMLSAVYLDGENTVNTAFSTKGFRLFSFIIEIYMMIDSEIVVIKYMNHKLPYDCYPFRPCGTNGHNILKILMYIELYFIPVRCSLF